MTKLSEHHIQNTGRNALAKPGIFNTRVNVGRAWVGSEVIRLASGDMLIKNPRPFETGVPAGFTDTFGVTSQVITQDMVGQTVGIAHFIEYKSTTGKPTERQQAFIAAMKRLGARAGVARSAADAVAIAEGRAP